MAIIHSTMPILRKHGTAYYSVTAHTLTMILLSETIIITNKTSIYALINIINSGLAP